jgi:hypothetical protein
MKLTAFMVGVVGLFAVAIGSIQGCGGGSSSGNAANCNKVCDKAVACTPGATAMDKTTCVMQCNAQTMGLHCSNQAAINSAVDACVKMTDCNAAMSCLDTIPDCQSTSGTAGTGGGGTRHRRHRRRATPGAARTTARPAHAHRLGAAP